MARIATVGWIGLAAALALGAAGCNRSQTQSQEPDPASANLAPADQSGQPAQDQTAAAPAQEAQYQGSPEQLSEAPQPPPPLPDYSQPPCPGDNYLWTPGYWGYSQAGYYWAPGAWVTAPFVGALWTPSYWGFSGGHYLWHAGYWGPHVGFYGGINYGFGYTGLGFSGGYWGNGVFNYNRLALNVGSGVHHVYDHAVVNYTPVNRISFNGRRGIGVQATASEGVAFRERRMEALPAQTQLRHEAVGNRAQFASENGGRPAMVAAPRGIEGGREAAAPPAAREAPGGNARPEAREPNAGPGARPEMPAARPESRAMPESRPEARPSIQRPEQARPAPAARPTERPAGPAPGGRPGPGEEQKKRP